MRFIDAKQIVFLQGLERERLVLKPNHIRGYQYSRGTPEGDSTQGLAHCSLTLLPGGPVSK